MLSPSLPHGNQQPSPQSACCRTALRSACKPLASWLAIGTQLDVYNTLRKGNGKYLKSAERDCPADSNCPETYLSIQTSRSKLFCQSDSTSARAYMYKTCDLWILWSNHWAILLFSGSITATWRTRSASGSELSAGFSGQYGIFTSSRVQCWWAHTLWIEGRERTYICLSSSPQCILFWNLGFCEILCGISWRLFLLFSSAPWFSLRPLFASSSEYSCSNRRRLSTWQSGSLLRCVLFSFGEKTGFLVQFSKMFEGEVAEKNTHILVTNLLAAHTEIQDVMRKQPVIFHKRERIFFSGKRHWLLLRRLLSFQMLSCFVCVYICALLGKRSQVRGVRSEHAQNVHVTFFLFFPVVSGAELRPPRKTQKQYTKQCRWCQNNWTACRFQEQMKVETGGAVKLCQLS